MKIYDRIIIGAGIYGLYAAIESMKKKKKVLVVDMDEMPFNRGSYINQARLHNGYHYPRSYSTASKSAHYFKRFYNDFKECINDDFEQIYAVASDYSWTNGEQFQRFSDNLGVICDEIPKEKYFNSVAIDKAFYTEEYSFDAFLLKNKLYNEAKELGCDFLFGKSINSIESSNIKNMFVFSIDEKDYSAGYVLNATYAGTNQIHNLLGYEEFNIKYELCEVILCRVSDNIKNVGLTVMDGPFFSVMPFGKSGYHSITTVSKTPHLTCYEKLPIFDCQNYRKECTPISTCNCNYCEYRPKTAFIEMRQIAKKYLKEDIEIDYVKSLFTLKPIIKASEIDDSRPTIIRKFSSEPDFYTVFSGKINTMYDLDCIL
ncbi:NAD(P)-binding Rossmann-like domain protein [Peptoanaerobacter stomatis]|uniref:NAD(P)-binding Rossmann-like domain protein n=1 Tax=Peptoanaerobacter stomatis TaxID=796937 RepID=J5ULX6_9FIRM|nr:FAD-dependent oxidoreductase [Peptoanaerobacter stomatis]EJU23549.1 NAD(P)-binding Rossmann-like domain protein [Peptoanaerobacter stomatis]NWO24569.1 FAD-dependent oxidoreductase [Peptostreptococcaceae bacterium oral taxon 081]